MKEIAKHNIFKFSLNISEGNFGMTNYVDANFWEDYSLKEIFRKTKNEIGNIYEDQKYINPYLFYHA